MKRNLLPLLLLPLVLTSCNPGNSAFYVPVNLDLYTSENVEHANPIDINVKFFRTLIESKTSFVLYYYSTNCESCKKAKPLIEKYLIANDILMYQIDSFEVYKNYAQLGNWSFIFEEARGTPQIMFFDKGQFTAMMPQNKYSSGYNAFEGTMNNAILQSNILVARTEKSLEYFFSNFKQYMIYFAKSYDGTEENHFANYGIKTFNDNFYDLVKKQKSFVTLYLNQDDLTPNAYKMLNEKYKLEEKNDDYLVTLHRTTLTGTSDEVLSYRSEDGINNIVSKINEYFITLG